MPQPQNPIELGKIKVVGQYVLLKFKPDYDRIESSDMTELIMSYTIMKNVDPASHIPKDSEIRDFVDFERAFDQVIEKFVDYGYVECMPAGGFKLTAAGKACLLAPENRQIPEKPEGKSGPTKHPRDLD
jgi:hypothetical protein